MKNYEMFFILILSVCIFSCKTMPHKYFEIQKVNCNILGNENSGFKITLRNEPTTSCTYNPGVFENISQLDKYSMVEELLSFEGDTRACVLNISNYNPLSSQMHFGDNRAYTLQLEALFIINQIMIKSPFNYSPSPILFDKKNDRILYGNEAEMKEIYSLYGNWLSKVKQIGIEGMNKKSLDPLESSNYRWY